MEAWDITTGKDSVLIAVIDDGVKVFSGHFPGKNISCINVDSDPDSCDGVQEHGTAIAALIGAPGDDGSEGEHDPDNMCGVCWGCSMTYYNADHKTDRIVEV